ncbi:MAG: hypothetical protein WCE38_02175 [Burkholderiales bacterium]
MAAKITAISLTSLPRRVPVASHQAGGLRYETHFGETEPLPGERTGNANGTSRLNDAYWARQAENEAAVKEAKARRTAAVAARNAARF